MKLRPVTKRYKWNKATLNKFDGDAMSKNVKSLSYIQFMVNLEQTGSRIPNA